MDGPSKKISATEATAGKKAGAIPDRQIMLELGDVLPLVPERFLKKGCQPDLKKELRLALHELLPGLAQGKVSVPISRIAGLLSDPFAELQPAENVEIHLPLKKIVAQIGTFPTRPDQLPDSLPLTDPQVANWVVEKRTASATPDVESGASTADEPEIEQPPEPPVEDEMVSYSLASILPHVPGSMFKSDMPPTGDAVRITVPFRLIEPQLAGGKVELAIDDFLQAPPEGLGNCFFADKSLNKTARIPVPLAEVIQNLPGVDPLPPFKSAHGAAQESEPEQYPDPVEIMAVSPKVQPIQVAPPPLLAKNISTAPSENPSKEKLR